MKTDLKNNRLVGIVVLVAVLAGIGIITQVPKWNRKRNLERNRPYLQEMMDNAGSELVFGEMPLDEGLRAAFSSKPVWRMREGLGNKPGGISCDVGTDERNFAIIHVNQEKMFSTDGRVTEVIHVFGDQEYDFDDDEGISIFLSEVYDIWRGSQKSFQYR